MKSDSIILVENYVKKVLTGDRSHGYDHAIRVRNWAIKIAKTEHYSDLDLIETVALLHDIGFSKTKRWEEHAKVGAVMAVKFLRQNNLLTPSKTQLVEKVIINHSNSVKTSIKPLRILRDADMLDMVGAMGIVRTIISQNKRPVYDEKDIKGSLWESNYIDAYKKYNQDRGAGSTIVDQLNFQLHCLAEMSTEYAKRIARPMCKYMINFVVEIEKEVNSNKYEN